MKKQNVMYHKRLKALQIAHKPSKWEARRHYNWKKEWGPFIKYDADWDGFYLIKLIVYKLEKMRVSFDIYSPELRKNLEERLVTMDSAIALGKKILLDDYDKESIKHIMEHDLSFVLVYKKTGSKEQEEDIRDENLLAKLPVDKHRDTDFLGFEAAEAWATEHGYNKKDIYFAYSAEWDTEASAEEFKNILKKEEKAKQKDYDDFFKIIAKNIRGWWY